MASPDCPSYAHERWLILNSTSGRPPRLAKLLSSAKLLLLLVNFIKASGCFKTEPNAQHVVSSLQ